MKPKTDLPRPTFVLLIESARYWIQQQKGSGMSGVVIDAILRDAEELYYGKEETGGAAGSVCPPSNDYPNPERAICLNCRHEKWRHGSQGRCTVYECHCPGFNASQRTCS